MFLPHLDAFIKRRFKRSCRVRSVSPWCTERSRHVSHQHPKHTVCFVSKYLTAKVTATALSSTSFQIAQVLASVQSKTSALRAWSSLTFRTVLSLDLERIHSHSHWSYWYLLALSFVLWCSSSLFKGRHSTQKKPPSHLVDEPTGYPTCRFAH